MGGGLIIEANIPVQELEGQRGEGAYFREDTVLRDLSNTKMEIFPPFEGTRVLFVHYSPIKHQTQGRFTAEVLITAPKNNNSESRLVLQLECLNVPCSFHISDCILVLYLER